MVESFDLEIGRTAALDEATRSAVVKVCIDAHQVEDFANLFSYLPPDGLHVFGYLDGELVSHAVLTTRWLQVDNDPLMRTAYIDAVSTMRAFQGRGYGGAVMRRIADAAADAEYDIACLETERIGFYEQLGWEVWRGALGGRSEQGLVLTPDQKGIMILHLPRTPLLNVGGLLTIECSPARIW